MGVMLVEMVWLTRRKPVDNIIIQYPLKLMLSSLRQQKKKKLIKIILQWKEKFIIRIGVFYLVKMIFCLFCDFYSRCKGYKSVQYIHCVDMYDEVMLSLQACRFTLSSLFSITTIQYQFRSCGYDIGMVVWEYFN